eukprot:m51a1_g8859 putative serine threonine-protein kinase ctr1-like (1197) ;mRNA; r:547515-551820
MLGRPARCPNATGVVVVGQSVGTSQTEMGAAHGLSAAIDEANKLTTLKLKLVQYNHSSEDQLVSNVHRLVEEDCAFMIAASTPTGTGDTEDQLLGYLSNRSVPLVGTLSASMVLRVVENLTASFVRQGLDGSSADAVRLPYVVNVRAAGIDELNAVLSMLSHDWDTLSHVGLVGYRMKFGDWAMCYVNDSLRVLTGHPWGLRSFVRIDDESLSDAQMDAVVQSLLGSQEVKVLIVATTPGSTAHFLSRFVRAGHRDLAMFFVASVSPEDLEVSLSPETKSLLASRGIHMFFTQNMPFPTPANPWQATSLLRRFARSQVPPEQRSHMALEGYLTGWFIYEVAQQAVARNGLPLTQWSFLNTVFVDARTFNVLGMTLGPYGDGGISGGASTQSEGDKCNQGVHEVYMTQYNPSNDTQTPIPPATFKFAGCMAPEWSAGGLMTVVGSFDDTANGVDTAVRTGLLGAVNDYNAEGTSNVLLRSRLGTIDNAENDLEGSKVIALVVSDLLDLSYVQSFETVAAISPVPGYFALTRPFRRRLINLFPSAYDEMAAAAKFFRSYNLTNVAVIKNGAKPTSYTEECARGWGSVLDNSAVGVSGLKSQVFTAEDATAFILQREEEFEAFLVLGGTFDASRVPRSRKVRLLNSQVKSVQSGWDPNSTAEAVTYTISVFPPLINFASTSALRTEYNTWVSSDDSDGLSFMGFFVGKFLSQVIDVAKGGDPNKTLTPDDLINAVYQRSVFTIEGLQFGPFRDKCSSSVDCCNQGSNTVYILRGSASKTLEGSFSVGNCGRWYVSQDTGKSDDNTNLVLGLSIGLGGGFLICIAALTAAVWRTRASVEFYNIRRTELDLGQCLGRGRYGALYMADWHGTTVAVRVIDKKVTPKEDQRLIKEEVLLLHKLHHPNLLMLMGYCETHTDILVTTEYMEGGSLADYLRKEKRYASEYSLIAMAFDVLKGIAYLHSCKPPIVHGNICTNNLLIDSKGTVKVTDFWFSNRRGAFSADRGVTKKRAAWQPPEVIAGTFLTPATDVYAFAIVLWELIAPPEMTQSSSTSGTATGSQASPAASPAASPGMLSINMGSVVEMRRVQMGPPEIPPNSSPEVADLLEHCWQTQPERRPSVFQILRSWPTTFATQGAFEVPEELIKSAGSANAAGLFAQHSNNSANNSVKAETSDDEMASMMSIMPLKVDSVAMQRLLPPKR